MPPPSLNNIYLTGFMGAGKSTVGRVVARELGWKFIDTDHLIEEAAGMRIGDFFTRHGEEPFRVLEAKVVQGVTDEHRTVVSLGGGALLDEKSRQRIFESGLLIYLRAEAVTLTRRLERTSHRPLVKTYQGRALEKRVTEMLAVREPFYQLASIHIDTEGKAAGEVAAEVIRSFESCKKSD